MPSKKSSSEWQKIIKAWRSSGINKAEFCRQHKIPVSTFDYWKRKFSRGSHSTGLVKIGQSLVSNPGNPYGMKVTTREFALEIAPGVQFHEVRTMLQACREILCS